MRTPACPPSELRPQQRNGPESVPVVDHSALAGLAVDIFRCPLHPDAAPLRTLGSAGVSAGGTSELGELVCPNCGRSYPVAEGIVDLLAPGEDSFREREMSQWDEQAARYEPSRREDAIYQAGVRAAARALRPRPGELVLDAGCGTGMVVRRYFRPGLRLVCLDLSRESLWHVRQVLPPRAACYVRGDLTALPFADGAFDRVLCANALQHLPDAALRRAAFEELGRVVRPGGQVVVTVHNYSRRKRRAGWPKESEAKGNSGPVQYIYRFDAAEFRDLLACRLHVERVCGIGLPLPYRLKLSWLSRGLERLLSRCAASAAWGNMLLGVARRPALPSLEVGSVGASKWAPGLDCAQAHPGKHG
jgi:SAM-dependent methyltransferase